MDGVLELCTLFYQTDGHFWN